MKVGAFEASRWAGLVFAAGPGEGIGFRIAFTDRHGRRFDRGDWYDLVSEAGPHAPDGSYARVSFDVAKGTADAGVVAGGEGQSVVLEWSRSGDGVAVSVKASGPGVLELIGDAPWDWRGRWREGQGSDTAHPREDAHTEHPTLWLAHVGRVDLVAAISPSPLEPGTTGPGFVSRSFPVDAGETTVVSSVFAWGEGAASRAPALLEGAGEWIAAARHQHQVRAPRSAPGCAGLVESVTDLAMWTVLLQPETGRFYVPAGRSWMFPRPEVGGTGSTETNRDDWTVFGWDSFLISLELGMASAELAWSALLVGLDSRYANGNVPNWRSRNAGTRDRSQPPVGSFAALKLHLTCPDEHSLRKAYPGLLAWSDWWDAPASSAVPDSSHPSSRHRSRRPRRVGIHRHLYSWGSDSELVPNWVPKWEVGASGRQRAAWESGQDDLPLWEEAEWDERRGVLAMSAVDLSSYRALDLECLARIARILGDGEKADRLLARRHSIVEAMNRVLWSDEAGLYLDRLPGRFSTRVAASNFLPLTAGVPSPERARRMVETLMDPDCFWGEWLLPTIARDDPAFTDQQYWRGSIWPPMNYLVLQGLRRYGFSAVAAEAAWRGARMFLADLKRTGMCRENFDARSGRGCGQRHQGWGPLLALGAVEEFVDASPWHGLTVGLAGSLAEADCAAGERDRTAVRLHLGDPSQHRHPGVSSLVVGGHRWSANATARGYRFKVNDSPWVEVSPGVPLCEVCVEPCCLTAFLDNAGDGSRLRVTVEGDGARVRHGTAGRLQISW